MARVGFVGDGVLRRHSLLRASHEFVKPAKTKKRLHLIKRFRIFVNRLRQSIHPEPLPLLLNHVVDRHGMTALEHQLADFSVRGKHDPLVHSDLPDRKNRISDLDLAWAALLTCVTGGAQPEVRVVQYVSSHACISDDLSRDHFRVASRRAASAACAALQAREYRKTRVFQCV